MFKNLSGIPLKKTAVRLFVFGGAPIKQEGICRPGERFCDRFVGATFHVVNSEGPVLLGLQTSQELGLITLNLALKTDTLTTREYKAQTNGN